MSVSTIKTRRWKNKKSCGEQNKDECIKMRRDKKNGKKEKMINNFEKKRLRNSRRFKTKKWKIGRERNGRKKTEVNVKKSYEK